VPAAADAAAVAAVAAVAAAVTTGVCTAPTVPMIGVPVDEDGAFRRGGGVGGVNCRSIPS